jgi:TPR repeat protein
MEHYNEKRYDQAMPTIITLAEKGIVGAQARLGYCYFMGIGVAHDESKAHKWLTLAANQGDGMSKQMLEELFD